MCSSPAKPSSVCRPVPTKEPPKLARTLAHLARSSSTNKLDSPRKEGRKRTPTHSIDQSICLLLEGVTFPFYFDTGFGWQCVHEFRDDALLGAGAFFSLYLTFIFKEIHLRWFSNEKFFLIIEIYIFKKVTMKQMVSYSSGISQRYRSLVESVRSTKLSLPWHCFTCKGRGYNGNRRRPVIYK